MYTPPFGSSHWRSRNPGFRNFNAENQAAEKNPNIKKSNGQLNQPRIQTSESSLSCSSDEVSIFRFMELPYDIRETIYNLLVPNISCKLGEQSAYRPAGYQWPSESRESICPPLLLSNRQIHSEIMSHIYSTKKFYVSLNKKLFTYWWVSRGGRGDYEYQIPRWIRLPSGFSRIQKLSFRIGLLSNLMRDVMYVPRKEYAHIQADGFQRAMDDIVNHFSSATNSLQVLEVKVGLEYAAWETIHSLKDDKRGLRQALELHVGPLRKIVVRESVDLRADCWTDCGYTGFNSTICDHFSSDVGLFERTSELLDQVARELLDEIRQDIQVNSQQCFAGLSKSLVVYNT